MCHSDLSVSLFITALKSPPMIFLSIPVYSICLQTSSKKSGASLFGPYKLPISILSCSNVPLAKINLASVSFITSLIMKVKSIFIRIATPVDLLVPCENHTFPPHWDLHNLSTLAEEWTSCNKATSNCLLCK